MSIFSFIALTDVCVNAGRYLGRKRKGWELGIFSVSTEFTHIFVLDARP